MKKYLLCFLVFAVVDCNLTDTANAGVLVRDVRTSNSGRSFRTSLSTQPARSFARVSFSGPPATLESNPFERRIIKARDAELKYIVALQKWEEKTDSLIRKSEKQARVARQKQLEKEAKEYAKLRREAIKQQTTLKAKSISGNNDSTAPVVAEKPSLSETQRQPKPSSVFSENGSQNREGDRVLLSRRANKAAVTQNKPTEKATGNENRDSFWVHFKRALTGF